MKYELTNPFIQPHADAMVMKYSVLTARKVINFIKSLQISPPVSERPVRSPSPAAPPTHDGSYTDTFDSVSKTEDQVSSLGEKVQKQARKQGVDFYCVSDVSE